MNTAEDIVRNKGGRIVSVSPQATIDEALQVMVENRIGAVLVRDDEDIVGIWSSKSSTRQSAGSTTRTGDGSGRHGIT